MGRAFQIGDRVCLSVTGLCEVHSLDHGRPAPLHTGEVDLIGSIPWPSVHVRFDDIVMECSPEWLLLVTTKDGAPWHST